MEKISCGFVIKHKVGFSVNTLLLWNDFALRAFIASKSASPDFSADIKNDNEKNKPIIIKRNVGFTFSALPSMGEGGNANMVGLSAG